MKEDFSGSTSITMLIKKNKIYIANLGDSRCVACTSEGKTEPWSEDHKPSEALETARIEAAGGDVEMDRVNGKLAVSRAFGDFHYKADMNLTDDKQLIIATPDVQVKDLDAKTKFAILACDGIWEVLSNEEVIDFILEKLSEGK